MQIKLNIYEINDPHDKNNGKRDAKCNAGNF